MVSKQDRDTEFPLSLSRRMSRRRFLEIAGAAAAGLVISSCAPTAQSVPTEGAPAATEVFPTAAPPTATGAAAGQAASTAAPAATATAAPAAAATRSTVSGAGSKVAIAKADSYDRDLIYNTLRDMLDGLGGLGDVVKSGDRVAIKTNLTGGLGNNGPAGLSPMESFVTHPEVVRALVALVRDAGAKEVFVVEAVYQWGSYTQWGYEEVAKEMNATLIDLNDTAPYDDFVNVSVPGGGSGLYESYVFNPILTEVDAFMSVAKMKCHWVAGVTHSMKNLFGLVPARFYKLSPQHGHRSEFHGPSDDTAGQRVPEIIVDLNKARPINLALVDGILTTEGGEGPWIQTFGPIAPGVMFAGKDPVATDAVATAAQGFDPTGAAMTIPYVRGKNHIQLAADAGLGTNRLDEIETVGASIDDVRTQFKPCVIGM